MTTRPREQAGLNSCLNCADDEIEDTCSATTESAACCGASGTHTLCNIPKEGTTCEDAQFEDEALNGVDPASIVGRFIAIGDSMDQAAAKDFCTQHYGGLASIHSPAEQHNARRACDFYAGDSTTAANVPGCWIGFSDELSAGGFSWDDATAADYVNWNPGEPNDANDGENFVNIYFSSSGAGREPGWNDRASGGDADKKLFPLCQLVSPRPAPPAAGAPTVWGTGRTASFNVKLCVDHTDTVFFQDDRLWISYGGQYAAAGTHGSCPDRFKGKAYVNEQEWDISSLSSCVPGVGCAVSKTYTDEQFEVPLGCNQIDMQITQNAGRGQQPARVVPSRANSYRGEVRVTDEGFSGADVYDITVALTCLGKC